MNKFSDYNFEKEISHSIADFIYKFSPKYACKNAVILKDDFRTTRFTYQELYKHCCQVANYLSSQNIKKGEKVLIWYYNSPEWVVVFFACAISGVIAVPIDFNSDRSFVEKIHKKTKAKRVFASKFKKCKLKNKVNMEELLSVVKQFKNSYKRVEISPEDILEIVFTSGTTSEPKGVIIRNINIIANIHSLKEVIQPPDSSIFLSTIPLSHMLEQALGLFLPLRFGCSIVYTSSRKSSLLSEAIQEEKVSTIVTVPAFLKMLKEKINRQIEEKEMEKKFSLIIKLPLFIRKKIIGRKIKLLRSLKFFIVGGAPLDMEIENFWNQMGTKVLTGYGLTETSPIVSCNTLLDRKVGTVGKTLPNQEVSIKSDGEILCKGQNVFSGYFENEKATNKALKNKWFYTGDLGEIDNEGFLIIKGRKKNMILTDSGLNVYPEDIEQQINRLKEIKDSCVLETTENNRVIITAVVILKTKNDNLLEKINSKLYSHQKIQKLIIWPGDDFPRTHSLKIKRHKLKELLSKDSTISKSGKATDKLSNLLARLTDTSPAKVKEESNLYTDLHLDSLRRVELISILEEVYDVEVEEELINERSKVTDLRRMISDAEQENKVRQFSFWSFSPITFPFRFILQQLVFLFLSIVSRVKIEGRDNLNEIQTPVIFAMNHTSHLDMPTLIRSLPFPIRMKIAIASAEDFFFEIKKDSNKYFKKLTIFFIRLIFNAYPFSRENRVKKSLKRTGKILDKGFSIGICPEGTRSKTGKMGHFLTGIGLMAARMKVAVVPVKAEGLYEILPKGSFWPKPGKAAIKFGKPYLTDPKKSYIEIAQEIEKLVREL